MKIKYIALFSTVSLLAIPSIYGENSGESKYKQSYTRNGMFNPVMGELQKKQEERGEKSASLPRHSSHSIKSHRTNVEITPKSVTKNPDLIDDHKRYYMKLVKIQRDIYGTHEMPYHTYTDESGEDIKFQLKHVLPHNTAVHIKEIREIKAPTPHRNIMARDEETELEKAFRKRHERAQNSVANLPSPKRQEEASTERAPSSSHQSWRSRLKNRLSTQLSPQDLEKEKKEGETELEKALRARRERAQNSVASPSQNRQEEDSAHTFPLKKIYSSQVSRLTPESVKKNPNLIDDQKHYYMKLVKLYKRGHHTIEMPYHTYTDEPGEEIKFQLEHVLPHNTDIHIKEIREVTAPTPHSDIR